MHKLVPNSKELDLVLGALLREGLKKGGKIVQFSSFSKPRIELKNSLQKALQFDMLIKNIAIIWSQIIITANRSQSRNSKTL